MGEVPIEARVRAEVLITVDLFSAAKYQLDFLELVNKQRPLYGGPVLKNAIRRYEQFWLPLAGGYDGSEPIAPPLDVHWVWHCHMLAPVAYLEDCQRLVGQLVDHKQLNFAEITDKRSLARRIWESKYPTEPFDVSLKDELPAVDFRSACMYDIEAAVARQKLFFYQVSLPHFRDDQFLSTGLERYMKYIYLKKLNPDTFLVPCYDMDLVWHAHQLHPLAYQADTLQVLGRVLNHDDSVNDRSPGSKLNRADDTTRALWRENFGEEFSARGAMFRGDPPTGHLADMPPEAGYHLRAKKGLLRLTRLRLEGVDPKVTAEFSLAYTARDAGRRRESFLTLKGKEQREWVNDQTPEGLAKIQVDTQEPMNFLAFLATHKGKWALTKEKFVAEWEDFHREVDRTKAGTTMSHVFQLKAKSGSSKAAQSGHRVVVEGVIPSVKTGLCTLWIKTGDFTEVTMPEDVASMWGPIPLPKLPEGVANRCSVASHKLVDRYDVTQFTCRIIHSIPLMTSAVQVFHKDQMVCVSHLVTTHQLPKPDQLKYNSRAVTLDSSKAERVMLIKDNKGDWALVKGVWEGMRKGVAGVPGQRGQRGIPGVPGDPGYLKVKTHFLKSGRIFEGRVSQETNRFTFRINEVTVDLRGGRCHIDAPSDVIPQCACLAFSVAVLHVLCQPRKVDKDGRTVTSSVTSLKPILVGGRPISRVRGQDVAFFMAAGYIACVPSNSYYIQHVYVDGGGGGHDVTDLDDDVIDVGEADGDCSACVGDGADAGVDGGGGCGGCGGCGSGGGGDYGGGGGGGGGWGGDNDGGGGGWGGGGGDGGDGGGGGGCGSCGGCGGCGG